MRRVRLAICLIASLLLAGCLGPSVADWGTGSGSVSVNFSMEGTTVKSTLIGETRTIDNLLPVGCTPGSDGGTLEAGAGAPITITGYLAASQFYDAHDGVMGATGLDLGVTTAVAIQSMTFEEAASVVDGEGARIDVKQWALPLQPDTGAGSVDIDEVDSESESDWFVLGLIPTTENVLSGMKSLSEWHQPVKIHGYLVSASNASENRYGYQASWHKATNDCGLTVGTTNKEDAYVLVSQISLDGATVSANGEADDEWVQGDVPFLGRGGFIMFFLAGGIGGAVGLFVVSKGMIMRSASRSMRVLIGEEGMKKAASVKKDAKAAKQAGMESPEERQRRTDRKRREMEKENKREQAAVEKSPKKEKNEDALGGFDLDSVLASTSTSRGPGGSAPTGRKSSVVATEAANNMDRMKPQQETPPPTSRADTVPQQRRRSPPSNAPSQRAVSDSEKPKVRRRKAVKKAAPQPAEETSPPAEVHDEDENFSDFSF